MAQQIDITVVVLIIMFMIWHIYNHMRLDHLEQMIDRLEQKGR